MDTFIIRSYQSEDEQAVIDLWFACNLVVSVNNPKRDIERKLQVNPELFLVATLDDKVVGTCMVGYEGHRGWINYLAVAPDYRRQGIAARLMAAAEEQLKALGCPKINLQVRKTNTEVIKFYERIGYQIDDVVGMGKRLETDPAYPS